MSTVQRFAWLDGLFERFIGRLAVLVPKRGVSVLIAVTAPVGDGRKATRLMHGRATPNLYSNVARSRPVWARPTRRAHPARARVCDTHATIGSAWLLPGSPPVMRMKVPR